MKQKYQRVTLKDDNGKGGFTDTPENVSDYMAMADNPEDHDINDVWMTPDKYDRLPEFEGF